MANGSFPKPCAPCSSHTCSQSKTYPTPHKAAKISGGGGVEGRNKRNERKGEIVRKRQKTIFHRKLTFFHDFVSVNKHLEPSCVIQRMKRRSLTVKASSWCGVCSVALWDEKLCSSRGFSRNSQLCVVLTMPMAELHKSSNLLVQS